MSEQPIPYLYELAWPLVTADPCGMVRPDEIGAPLSTTPCSEPAGHALGRHYFEVVVTVPAALDHWIAVQADQQEHRLLCVVCTPDAALCPVGADLAEAERSAWRLLHEARRAAL